MFIVFTGQQLGSKRCCRCVTGMSLLSVWHCVRACVCWLVLELLCLFGAREAQMMMLLFSFLRVPNNRRFKALFFLFLF